MKARFNIREFTNPSGEVVFRVDGKDKDGKRIRENYKTIEEATGRKQALEVELLNMPSTPLVSTKLTAPQVQDAEFAFAALKGKPLMDAVRFYLDNYQEPVKKKPLAEALEEFLSEKRHSNARPATVQNLRIRNLQLVNRNPDKLVSEIQPDHIKNLIQRPTLSPVTRDNIRRALMSFFSWATKQQYCASSPVDKIERVKFERPEPQVLPVDDARRLLQVASDYKDGTTLPYVAMALFCAIRPEELAKITWKNINLDEKTVTIGSEIAKMRERRIVEISDNCIAWLLPHAVKKTPIRGKNWRRDFDTVKALAGYGGREKKGKDGKPVKLKEWPIDVMRHTGISHHLVEHQHEGKTAAWAGNSPDVIQRHYKGLVSKSDSKEFWSIKPDSKGKILKLHAA